MLKSEFRLSQSYLFAAAIICTTNLLLLLGALLIVYKYIGFMVPKIMNHELFKLLTPEKIALIISIIIIMIIYKIIVNESNKKRKHM